ncbi:hypothetical protein BOTBODRAFT_58215 [Botryobasidium botryosum FD-172 SS1]|uniref:Uncharacterized protein n=1 Tax=Botryobasidium botryosum (strain FD-172 SS1) TaxID=930990 RepID=A0A067MFJ5_BOTB1|nr:hypothetical protein BOTBODRAFT_58215 [Botryobasidium botryosum FD-172 SS1]
MSVNFEGLKVIETGSGPAYLYTAGGDEYILSVSLMEFQNTIDKGSRAIKLQVYFKPPFVGKMDLGETSGNLTEGVKVSFENSGLTAGWVSAFVRNNQVIQAWKFSAFGKEMEGEAPITSL